MHPKRASRPRLLAALILVPALLVAPPAARGDELILDPGPSGEDSTAYEFVPLTNRGQALVLWQVEDTTGHTWRSAIHFDLSGVTVDPATITSAALRLYYNSTATFDPPSADPSVVEAYLAVGAWSEATTLWGNFPTAGTLAGESAPISAFGSFDIPVTQAVKDWLTTPSSNNGLLMMEKAGTPDSLSIGVASFEEFIETEQRPKLVITTGVPVPGLPGAAAVLLALALLSAVAARGRAWRRSG